MARVRFTGEGKIFLFSVPSRSALGPIQPPIQWVLGALQPKVKRQERESDHSLRSSADVKNDEAIPSFPHTSSWRDG
jgi:hypothetical protein